MSGDNEEAGLAAAAGASVGGAAGLAAAGASVGGAAGLAAAGASATDPINEEHPLPALLSIWDCPMFNKIPDLMIMGIHMLGGHAAGAPYKTMGPHQNPFVLQMQPRPCTCIKAHWI